MYVVAVVLPPVQAEFGISRANASLPYTLMMICLGLGGVWTGKLADRYGISRVLWMGSAAVLAGFVLAGLAPNIWVFGLAHGLLLGLLGSSATFAPLMADTSLWWNKRRGIAVAICASGNYVAGAVWPPLAQFGIERIGWRYTYIAMGLFCGVCMALLSFAMRQRPPLASAVSASAQSSVSSISFPSSRPFGLQLGQAQILLCVAGFSCCVAMAMREIPATKRLSAL
jgi:MFS family permease